MFASVIIAFFADPAVAWAQTPGASERRAAAARIEISEAPTIDADLTDPAWAKATVIDDFRQKEPYPGAPATERTVVRVMFDADNLYFGIYAYDSMPDRITVRSMARDGPLFTGDSVSIVLDPGLTRRDAYSFEVGPSGGRNDSLFLNNTMDLDEWDAIWAARGRRVADGWVAEVAIPFRSLSYDNDQGDWGFDVSRGIRYKNEEVSWSLINPALDFTDISQAGTLTGITNINQGVGLDVQVYGALRAKRDWHIPGDDTAISGKFGGNAFYKITPALMGTLTVNPDFSDAPLDVRQVNTSRFSLFFPETRDFFLQDAAAFEFGGTNFSRDGDDRAINNARPFFSRNLGLVDGVPVSILGGGKLSGQFAGTSIGALSVVTDRSINVREQVLSVLRMTRPVLSESRAGFVVTHGDPTGDTRNTVAGGDFEYRNSNFLGDKTLLADVFYERSFSSAVPEDDSFGAAVAFPNEPWEAELAFKEVGANFAPALGFANRTGIRLYDGAAGYIYRFQDSFLRTLQFAGQSQYVTDLHDRLETRESQIQIEAETNAADQFEIQVQSFFENIPEEFDVADSFLVPAGKYEWTNIGIGFETSDARPLAIDLEISCCSFYDGQAVEASVELSFRPNEYFEINTGYEANFIDMPAGKVDIHVLTTDAVVNFTPDMQLALQAQYDNISESFGLLARYRWEYQPGNELFVAFGQSAFIPGAISRGLRSKFQTSQFSVRLGQTFRF